MNEKLLDLGILGKDLLRTEIILENLNCDLEELLVVSVEPSWKRRYKRIVAR